MSAMLVKGALIEMEFTLFKRKGKNGAYTYYARFWDMETGELIKTLSTRKTSFKKATLWALEQVEDKGSNGAKNYPTFQDYTESDSSALQKP